MIDEKSQPHYVGHRQRLKDKLITSGHLSLPDYEILELLLSIAIPRCDVKPLAKELITTFGSFSRVIGASNVKLKEVKGVGDGVICMFRIVETSSIRLLGDKIRNNDVLVNWQDVINYCLANIGGRETEEFHVLYLNTKCHLIQDETHSTGTVNASGVYPREILKRVLELGATSIIIVHNHPTGDTTPSRADIQITQKILQTLKTIDVNLIDHIIVSHGNYISFKALSLI